MDYERIADLASRAKPFLGKINPDDSRFLDPADMLMEINAALAETGQDVVDPMDAGQVARIVFESLAVKYRIILEGMQQSASIAIERLHIVGGGAKNRLLNQLTASFNKIPVYAGPYEASATGNILMQAYSRREISGLEELREIVYRSVEPQIFYPENDRRYDDYYQQYVEQYGKF